MQLNRPGYHLTQLLYGLFSAMSLQKSVRDRREGVPVTAIYCGLCWFSLIAALLLLFIGLWNATLPLSENGFYGMAYALSLFAAVAVQKNTRDSLRVAMAEDGREHMPRILQSGDAQAEQDWPSA